MDTVISRRNMLKAGGALGVLGVLATAAPAWAWNSNQSVAGGSLDTLPPENVWDPVADAVVRRLFTEEGIGRIDELNELLRPWRRNDQALPAGLPEDLAAFIEQARQPPPWLDRVKLADGFSFYETRGTYTGILYGLGSGIVSCAIPDEARAVYHSKGGEDMRDRVAKTAKLGYDVGTENAFDPDGEMIVTCIKTRLTHSAVRHLITTSPRWNEGAEMPAPISQRDLMITWHSLATFIHRTLANWEVESNRAEEDGFLHVWQVTAHYLGVADVYIPATWTDARVQSDQTLDAVLAPTPEGIALAATLLDLAAEYDGGASRPVLNAMTHYMTGTNNAGQGIGDMLQIPHNAFWDRSIRNGWPQFVATRELGTRLPLANRLFWVFDEILRTGVLWGLQEGPPSTINIEMPTANRSEESYPGGSY
ncbi:oxygenase MpaB family protein [Actinospongicola halichondriae]|uniref:oxygenase MpaB family protein n=1 Tax=Actinospongicola halichondriae TaxID=3236844 RepID=UPI003D56D1E4